MAIPLPANVRHKVQQHIDGLRKGMPDARASWTREHNLHLTLKFFGDTAVERVEQLSHALKAAAKTVQPFEIEIGGCGAFPPRGKPNVLWIGINDPSNNLHNLYEALKSECATAGFERERRPFNPHLTIARIRNPRSGRPLAQLHQATVFDSQPVEVNDVCLIRSELSREGSRYTVLARHQFRDNDTLR